MNIKPFFASVLLIPALLFGAKPHSPEKTTVVDGTIRTWSSAGTAFSDSFGAGLGQWNRPLNHNGIVTFRTDTVDGKRCMLWINERSEKKAYDTETAIGSNPFPIKNAVRLQLEFQAKSTTGKLYGGGVIRYRDYDFKINWYKNGQSKPFSITKFDCETSPDRFVQNRKVFDVPAGAETATLHFGFGMPNLQQKQYVAFADVKVMTCSLTGPPVPQGSFITAPMRIQGTQFKCVKDPGRDNKLLFSFSYGKGGETLPSKWTPWTEPSSSVTEIQPPAGADWVQCKVIFQNSGEWSAGVRDIVIGKCHAGPFRDFITPTLPETKIVTNAGMELSFSLCREAEIDFRNTILKVDGKDAKSMFEYMGGGIIRMKTVPLAALKKGIHSLYAKVTTVDGGEGENTILFRIGAVRKTSPQVTLRKDGMMMVDQKPFFPIGFYVLGKCAANQGNYDVMFRELKKNGFNFGREVGWFHTPAAAREFALAAQKNDFRVFMSCSYKGANTHDIASMGECISSLEDIPSILLWYTGDDASGHNSLAQMMAKKNAVAAVDPGRLTVAAEQVDRCAPTFGGAEVFHPEIYPVQILKDGKDTRNRCVEQVSKDMDTIWKYSSKDPKKPIVCVHPLIQCFGSRNPSMKSRWLMPTPVELRAMTYEAIVRGSHGMIWYMYGSLGGGRLKGGVDEPAIWKELCTMAKELSSLQDVLTAETGKQPAPAVILKGQEEDSAGRSSVHTLLKESKGRRVLLAVNIFPTPAEARFTVRNAKKVKVLFEKRTLKAEKDGSFTDQFAPYAVHIYEL